MYCALLRYSLKATIEYEYALTTIAKDSSGTNELSQSESGTNEFSQSESGKKEGDKGVLVFASNRAGNAIMPGFWAL